MSIFLIIAGYAIIGVLFLIIIIGLFWEKSLLMNKAPFVPIPKDVLPAIAKELNLKPGLTIYDLGCGDGRVLEACLALEPQAHYIGIEKELVPYCLAWWRLRKFIKSGQVQLIKKNFFAVNLTSAQRVFTYLFPKLMDELLPKLNKELIPDTILISCDFLFSNKQSEQVTDLKRPHNALGKRLYRYQF